MLLDWLRPVCNNENLKTRSTLVTLMTSHRYHFLSDDHRCLQRLQSWHWRCSRSCDSASHYHFWSVQGIAGFDFHHFWCMYLNTTWSSVEWYSLALTLISFLLLNQVHFTLTADAQVLPQSLNVPIGGVANKIYLIVQDIGHDSGTGLDFVFGIVALQRFYCVLDTGNQRIGFAQTCFTNASINLGSN